MHNANNKNMLAPVQVNVSFHPSLLARCRWPTAATKIYWPLIPWMNHYFFKESQPILKRRWVILNWVGVSLRKKSGNLGFPLHIPRFYVPFIHIQTTQWSLSNLLRMRGWSCLVSELLWEELIHTQMNSMWLELRVLVQRRICSCAREACKVFWNQTGPSGIMQLVCGKMLK